MSSATPTHSTHRSGAEGAPAAGQGRKEVPGLPHAAQQDVYAAAHGTPPQSPSLALSVSAYCLLLWCPTCFLCQADPKLKGKIQPDELAAMFGNIKPLTTFHTNLLKQLESVEAKYELHNFFLIVIIIIIGTGSNIIIYYLLFIGFFSSTPQQGSERRLPAQSPGARERLHVLPGTANPSAAATTPLVFCCSSADLSNSFRASFNYELRR